MSDDAAVLAEIARLTSAIEQRKAAGPTPLPSRGSSRGRGRGRGRGAYTAVHRNATWVAPGRSGAPTPADPPAITATTLPSATPAPPPAGGYRNQTLVLNQPVSRSGSLSAPTSAAPSRRTSPVPEAAPTLAPAPPPREVVIDGVVFVADQRGNKLVRKPDSDSAAVASASADAGPPSPSLSTPKRASHLGTTYIRTKAGNLVSLAFARRRKELADAKRDELATKGERLDRLVGVVKGVQAARNARGRGRGRGRGGFTSARPAKPKSDKLCRFFQRTGQCSRAHTCPYVHDSSKIAICPLFLRSACPRAASSCPLSHAPNAHRAPHCVHFPQCTRAACPYAHVKLAADAPVCRAFVELGWCDDGEACEKRHVRECWRFAETGRCEVKGCREPHVLRRVHSAEEEDEGDDEGDGEELAIEWEEGAGAADEDDEDDGAADSRRRKRAHPPPARERDGISGAAGRRLKKRLRVADGGFDVQEDFVELMVPLSDDDDEGMSVDSDDLEDGDDDEEMDGSPAPALRAPGAATTAALATSAARHKQDEDELDYGDDDDENEDADDDADVEQLLRR